MKNVLDAKVSFHGKHINKIPNSLNAKWIKMSCDHVYIFCR